MTNWQKRKLQIESKMERLCDNYYQDKKTYGLQLEQLEKELAVCETMMYRPRYNEPYIDVYTANVNYGKKIN